MGVIIRNGIEYSGAGMGGGSCDCDIVYLTQEEYDALPASKESDNVEYRITNANTSVNAARDWAYDNSESGLEAETVQDAIDEVTESLENLPIIKTGNVTIKSDSTTVTFSEPFPEGRFPQVVACYNEMQNGSVTGNPDTLKVCHVSLNSFIIATATSSTTNRKVTWIAIA